MTAPTDVPTFPVGLGSPAARAARAAHLHRRLQLEHAYLTRARQEFHSGPAATRAMRTAYILARYGDALAAHDTRAPADTSEVAA